MKETDELILEQLVILNKSMRILVEEHLRHFAEWRDKNV